MQPLAPLAAAVLLATTLPAQGYAVSLTSGVHGGIEVPFHAATVPPTGLTVEAWIRFDDASMPTGVPYFPTLIGQDVGAPQPSWRLRVASGSTNDRVLEFAVRDAANVVQVLSHPFAPGELADWTHLAATYDGQVMRLFENGVPVATRTLPANSEVQNAGGVLRIGNGDTTIPGRQTWNGMIDEVRIWPMPRSGAEISAAMNQSLMGMPRPTVTFNLEGEFRDSSSGLNGTPFGALNAFADGPPQAVLMPGGTEYGESTTTCARTIDITLGSLPTVGNGAFHIWSSNAPRSSPIGFFAFAAQQAPVQPPVLGVSLAFTPPSLITSVAYAPGSFGLGLQRQPLPIPNAPGLIGLTVFGQFLFGDPACGPQGISASNGLTISIQ